MSNNNIAKMTTNNNSVNTPSENANKWRSFREVSPTHDTILQRKSDGAPPESPGFSAPRRPPPDVPSVVSPNISTNALVWQTKIEIAIDQYENLGKYIEKMKEESKLPIYLQGKSTDEKNKINISFNPILSKDEYECDSENEDKSVTSRVEDKSKTERIKDKSERITKPTISKNVSLSHKEALNVGQDKFFEEFTLTEDEIKKIKNDMSKSTEKKIEIHRVNIDNDEILIDTYKFSKKHYLAQKWFTPKIINYYRENFNEKFITVGKSVNTVIITINI